MGNRDINDDPDINTLEEKNEIKKRELKGGLISLAFALGGLALTVGSFFSFHYLSKMIGLTVLICLVDIVYAYFNARIFFKSKEWNGAGQIFIPLMMVVYWAFAFSAVLIFNTAVLNGTFSYSFFIYPVFLMPAFVIEIILVAIICSGL